MDMTHTELAHALDVAAKPIELAIVLPTLNERANLAPLVDRLDTILCSVGPATFPLSTLYRNFLRLMAPREDVDRLSDLIDGDLCGLFLKRSRLNVESSLQVDRMNAVWTGIQPDKLKACAEQADFPRRPGVVVCAAGERKARPLLNAIENGLVNVLIIDQECHDELLRLVRELV